MFKSSVSKWYDMKLMTISKSVFLLTSTINQAKLNKLMLSRPPSRLAQETVLLISKKGASYVSFWDKLKLRELRLVPCASELEHHLAQNLGKAHLPKSMKSQSFPVESCEFTLSNKNQSVFVLHGIDFHQNLSHQLSEALFTSQGSKDLLKLLRMWGSFTFRPRYQV